MITIATLCAPLASTVDPLLSQEAKQSFRQLISQDEIQTAIQSAAARIDADLQGEEVLLLVVLKGAMIFASDLVRQLQSPCSMEFIRARSYGMRGDQRGNLTVAGVEELNIEGKNVLVVEDIFDTGVTLSTVMEQLKALRPKTLRSVSLLVKKVEHLTDYRPDYSLFEIEDHFVIGYGLDYKELWRNLPAVYMPY